MQNRKYQSTLFRRGKHGGSTSCILGCLLGFSALLNAETFFYNFGTSTGTYTSTTVSTTFLPAAPSGNDLARGGNGGSVALVNPGHSGLGSGSELQLTAPTGGAVTKFAVNDWGSASSVYQMGFSSVVEGNSGNLYFFAGNGSTFADANGFSGSQSFTGLRLALGGTVESPTITLNNRNGGSWNATGLTSSSLTANSVLNFEIFGNNTSGSTTYVFQGSTITLASNTFDLYLNGTLIGDGLNKAQLANGAIDSFMFYGDNSTGNVGKISMDDVSYSNNLSQAFTWTGTGTSTTWQNGANGRFGTAYSSNEWNKVTLGGTAETVTVSGTVQVNQLVIETSGYDLENGTILLGGTSPTIQAGTGVTSTISSTLVGSDGLVKTGEGTVILDGENTYTGATTVTAGTLLVDGEITSNTTVTGGTLGGSGVIDGNVVIASGGTLAPGNSPGLLTIEGNLSLSGTVEMEIVSEALYDSVEVGGLLTFGGDLNITLDDEVASGEFILFAFANQDGSFTSVMIGELALAFEDGVWSGEDDTRRFEFSEGTGALAITAVPEPTEVAIAMAGLLLLVAGARRRQRRTSKR